jgi:hypothetical protein
VVRHRQFVQGHPTVLGAQNPSFLRQLDAVNVDVPILISIGARQSSFFRIPEGDHKGAWQRAAVSGDRVLVDVDRKAGRAHLPVDLCNAPSTQPVRRIEGIVVDLDQLPQGMSGFFLKGECPAPV